MSLGLWGSRMTELQVQVAGPISMLESLELSHLVGLGFRV